ncbi:hypothetical protein C8R44DRAFT_883235 [Mycena epipterygia]|nr:hypothetical protein C8R44DRAFT_883235 [Mycena epipterygia]
MEEALGCLVPLCVYAASQDDPRRLAPSLAPGAGIPGIASDQHLPRTPRLPRGFNFFYKGRTPFPSSPVCSAQISIQMLFSKFILPALAFIAVSLAAPTDVASSGLAIAHGGPTTSPSAIAEVNTSPVAISELVAPKPDDAFFLLIIIGGVSYPYFLSYTLQAYYAFYGIVVFIEKLDATIYDCQIRPPAGFTIWYTLSYDCTGIATTEPTDGTNSMCLVKI